MANFFILNNVIGIIDSGAGGANVIKECLKYYNEDFVYLVDNKNCPYGNKDINILKDILNYNINYLLSNYDLDLIIIACNTLSAICDYNFSLKYKTPILKTTPSLNGKNMLIFATKNTLKYSKNIKYLINNYSIKTLQIKGLPKVIDDYLTDCAEKNKIILNNLLKKKFYLNNNLKTKYKNVKYISLGCTHFKYIEGFLQNLFNNKISFLNCEEGVAKNSVWLIRKNKKNTTVKIILTKQDKKLFNAINSMFIDNK